MLVTMNEQMTLLSWKEDITLKTNSAFKDTMKELIKSESNKLMLCLEGVSYLNSSALGVIADSVMEARKNQKELVLVVTQNTVNEIFNIVKFGSFMKIFHSKQEGLQYFKSVNHE